MYVENITVNDNKTLHGFLFSSERLMKNKQFLKIQNVCSGMRPNE